jgi:hypothetical protein
MARNRQPESNRLQLGDIYSTLKDIEVLGVSLFRAAGSGGFQCILPKGTRVVVMHRPVRGASAVGVKPLNYAQLEPRLVPEAERAAPLYDGYGIIIDLKDLARHCHREPKEEVVFDSTKAQESWKLTLEHNRPTHY